MRLLLCYVVALPLMSQPSSIGGRVMHALNGQPVAEAELTLVSSGGAARRRTATADAQGRFSFDDLELGSYTLAFWKRGFEPGSYGARARYAPGRRLVLARDQHLDLALRLTPLGTISGKVVDPDGEPVAHVSILATLVGPYGNLDLTDEGGETNAQGEFHLPDLLQGRYFVRAIPPHLQSGDEFLMPSFYPSDAEASVPVTVAAGQASEGIKVTLRRTRGFRIRGRVESAGVPLSGVTLLLTEGRKNGFSTTPAMQKFSERAGSARALRDDGSFELTGVEPGSYELVIAPPGKQAVAAVTVVVADKDIDGVVLRVEPVRVSGRVRIEKDSVVPVGCGLMFNPVDRDLMVSTFGASSESDGRFTVERILPGRYSLQIGCRSQGIYVSSVHVGGESGSRDVVDSLLDIPAGMTELSMEVVFSADAAAVAGIVRDGDEPARNRWVVLVPEPAGREHALRVRTVFSGDDGRFLLTNVPPGDFRVYAWAEVLPGFLHMDPAFLQPFANFAVKVKASGGEQEQVEIHVTPPLR